MDHVPEIDLIELMAGRLDEVPRAQVLSHLAECEQCSQHYSELAKVWSVMDKWPAEPGRDLTADILGRLDEPADEATAPIRLFSWRTARMAAAVAMAIGLGHLAGRQMWHTPVSPPPTSEQVAADSLRQDGLGGPGGVGLADVVLSVDAFVDKETEG